MNVRKQREYDHQYLITASQKIDDDPTDMMRFVTHYMFTQLVAEGERQGIAKY